MKCLEAIRRIAHLKGLEKADATARATISLKKLAIGDNEAVRRIAHLKGLEKADAAARAMISLKKLAIGDEPSEALAGISPSDPREGRATSRLHKKRSSSVTKAYAKPGRERPI